MVYSGLSQSFEGRFVFPRQNAVYLETPQVTVTSTRRSQVGGTLFEAEMDEMTEDQKETWLYILSKNYKPKNLLVVGGKRCTSCGEVKPYDMFQKESRSLEGRRGYCKQCAKADKRHWYLSHKDEAITRVAKRKSKDRGVITAKEWGDLKAKYNYTCLACKRQEPEIELTLDHVKSLFDGGLNVIENAQPLCRSCNSSKGKRYIDYRPY